MQVINVKMHYILYIVAINVDTFLIWDADEMFQIKYTVENFITHDHREFNVRMHYGHMVEKRVGVSNPE